MAASRHYARAPITEAIIDLQVDAREGWRLADLELFGKAIETAYPTRKNLTLAQGRIEFGEKLSTSAFAKHIGFAFVTADEKQVVQTQLDGFKFSRLAPYQCWEPFRDEAVRWWRVYREQAVPVRVTRLAVRYINRIDIPLAQIELKDYFRTSPDISPDLPQILDGFFFQLALPQADILSHILLNQTIVTPPNVDATSVVLDIDLFRDVNLPQDDQDIWDFFETLHARKNAVFEACITDKTRDLIQ